MQKVRLLGSGRVQGVGFRYSTYALALDIGDIYGRVWNNDDGRLLKKKVVLSILLS